MDDPRVGEQQAVGADLLLGRETEMATLLAALDGAARGRGRLVLLSGEAGIGKTRLADALATEARARGVRVAWGRCWEAGGAPAYWPWLQAMRSLLRDLDRDAALRIVGPQGIHLAQVLPELADAQADVPQPHPEEPERARFQLFHAYSSALRGLAGQGPIVVILDDLHAADEPSLLLLRFVALDLAETPVLVLAIHREGEFEPADPRVGLLADVARVSAAQRVAPRGLTVEEVGHYLTVAGSAPPPPGLAEAVHRETEGNPLFVSEVVRLLAEEGRLQRVPDGMDRFAVTEGVRAVIGRRLARLSEPCHALLARASAIGSELPLDLVATLENQPTDELIGLLDEATGAHVLREVRGQAGVWRFAHALIRDVLYASLPAARRVALHRHIGEVLEQLHADDTEPPLAELAHHFVLAAPGGDSARAVHYARGAAARATRLHAHEEAARLYRLALAIPGRRDIERCRLLGDLGDAASLAGDQSTAREAFWQAARIAEEGGFVEELARAAVGYGGGLVWLRAGDDDRVIPLLERALAALPAGDSALRVRLLARLAGALRDEPSMDRRSTLTAEAVAMARRVGDRQALSLALTSRYAGATGPDDGEEMARMEREIRELTESADPWQQFQIIVVAAFGGDDGSLRAAVERLARLANELRQPTLLWYEGVMHTTLTLMDGRLADAESQLAENRPRGHRSQRFDADYSYRVGLFALRREQDRLDEVVDDIRAAVDDFPGYRHLAAMAAFADAACGRIPEARAALERFARGGYRYFPRDHGFLFGMVCLGEAALLVRDARRAAEIEAILEPYAGRSCRASGEISGGPVDRLRGRLAAFSGRLDIAVERLEAAQREVERSGARLWETRCAVELGRVLVDRNLPGDVDRARRLLDPALETCRALGLVAIEREAREALRLLEDRPRPDHAAHAAAMPGAATFRREGDVWSIGRDRLFRLRHTKGLAYLATLLAAPGREFHALDLAGGRRAVRDTPIQGALSDAAVSGVRVDTGAGDHLIDAEARSAYRARLRELQSELDEAASFNDPIRADRAREEIDALTAHLSAAFGLGGRPRTEGSPAERARQSVTKAIREAIRRVGAEDTALGEHLARSVRTGVYIAYDPDPAARIDWGL